MADTQAKPSGPDFGEGVDASVLGDGEKLLGHVQGEPVLLARVRGEYFAIGATCTHYGGPLVEGVIVEETIRCPWHHACFSLRTGDALEAPALNPVARWIVRERDGRLFVHEKVEHDPLAARRSAGGHGSPSSKVVIIGAGAAGVAAAEMLKRCGFEGAVTMIDEDPDAPYDRPNLSKDYLAGNAPEEWIPLRPPGFYADHGIDVVRATVTRLDVKNRTVEMRGRDPLPFHSLILATGAEPVRLSSTPGHDLPHVHYLRSLRDSRSIIQAAASAKHAVVIGASFIGLEVAASLRTRRSDLEVHVVAPEKLPLERVMGRELGAFIKSYHEERGVIFHLGETAQSIDPTSVTLAGGTRLTADLVVIGVGVRPRVQLAQDAGLRVDNGVLVSEFLETSAPGIYAVGDIARWPDPRFGGAIRVEHWVVAERQGQTAARNVLGARERFDQVPFFWSAHYDVSINYVGHAQRFDRTQVDGSAKDKDVAVRFLENGELRALATIFRDTESLEVEIAMERAAHA
jgi:NADPH-dependent 2,4-dienoyl-CoA reductase/sulfur reductase-like enzyme/nitrite reductase/ring-hydroxylating ferredoxin subunit